MDLGARVFPPEKRCPNIARPSEVFSVRLAEVRDLIKQRDDIIYTGTADAFSLIRPGVLPSATHCCDPKFKGTSDDDPAMPQSTSHANVSSARLEICCSEATAVDPIRWSLSELKGELVLPRQSPSPATHFLGQPPPIILRDNASNSPFLIAKIFGRL